MKISVYINESEQSVPIEEVSKGKCDVPPRKRSRLVANIEPGSYDLSSFPLFEVSPVRFVKLSGAVEDKISERTFPAVKQYIEDGQWVSSSIFDEDGLLVVNQGCYSASRHGNAIGFWEACEEILVSESFFAILDGRFRNIVRREVAWKGANAKKEDILFIDSNSKAPMVNRDASYDVAPYFMPKCCLVYESSDWVADKMVYRTTEPVNAVMGPGWLVGQEFLNLLGEKEVGNFQIKPVMFQDRPEYEEYAEVFGRFKAWVDSE